MIFDLPQDTPPIVPPSLLALPGVQAYLSTLSHEAPGLDATWDRAIALGLLVLREARADRLDEHRAIMRLSFDGDEADALVAAALVFLGPRAIPQGFADFQSIHSEKD